MDRTRRRILANQVAIEDTSPGVPLIKSVDFHGRRPMAVNALKPALYVLLRKSGHDPRVGKHKKSAQAGLEIAVEHLADSLGKGQTRGDLKIRVQVALKMGLEFFLAHLGTPHEGETDDLIQKHDLTAVLEIETIRATERMLSPRRRVITWSDT